MAAKCLQIDLTNFEYVKKQSTDSGRPKNPNSQETKLADNGESDSDLDETVVDDYSDELEDDIMDGENVSTNVNEYNFRKQKQMPNILDDDEHK